MAMDAKITSPSARGALAQRGNPYFRRLHKQLHLGYRKNESGGRWVARRKLDGRYESEVIGEADDAGSDHADVGLDRSRLRHTCQDKCTRLAKNVTMQ